MAADAGGAAPLVHRGLAWASWLLLAIGWVLVLSGVASLQQACDSQMVTTLSDLAQLQAGSGRRLAQALTSPIGFPGTVGYLAPVGCNKFFSYVWWIWALELSVLILLLGGIAAVARLRGMLVAASAMLLVLLMDTANTFLYFNHIEGLTSTVKSRARVLVAGSILSSMALFLLIAIIGWHNEDAGVQEHYDAEAAGRKRERKVHGPKAAGGGGLLGGLLGGGKKAPPTTQEPEGQGVPGSPRMIPVPRPEPVTAAPAAGSPRTPTFTTTTASPGLVPVSTAAAPIQTSVA